MTVSTSSAPRSKFQHPCLTMYYSPIPSPLPHFFDWASTHRRRTSGHNVPCKVSCDNCRSPLFDEGRNTVLAYPGSFHFKQGLVPHDFKPTAHIFYAQRVMEVPDGVCVPIIVCMNSSSEGAFLRAWLVDLSTVQSGRVIRARVCVCVMASSSSTLT